MNIGVPKEVKNQEHRVALTPEYCAELCEAGHQVFIEKSAGAAIGYSDALYQESGAIIVSSNKDVFKQAKLIVKVKEPQPKEIHLLGSQHCLFCYLHLAADAKLTSALVNSKSIAIAFETVSDEHKQLPLLKPMSEIAGRLAASSAVQFMQNHFGGIGLWLGGATGVAACQILIIGAGVVGENAARVCHALGAKVTIMDINLERLRQLEQLYQGQIQTVAFSNQLLQQLVPQQDVIIGAVLRHGASAPKLISKEQLTQLKPSCLLIDVAIDQGGCFASSKPTTYDDPSYLVDGIRHICIANLPGGVARTATEALCHATHSFIRQLADLGIKSAIKQNHFLRKALIFAKAILPIQRSESPYLQKSA